jgi:hypothetical protein
MSVPEGGSPLVYFISRNHLGDLDIAGDLVDVFDLIRLMRHMAWHEPLRWADRLGAAGFTDRGLEAVVRALTRRFGDSVPHTGPLVRDFRYDDHDATMTLTDGSAIVVPRAWRQQITDVSFNGGVAAAMISSTVPLHLFKDGLEQPPTAAVCGGLDDVEINKVFYRLEPHLMRRYTALALDNIERTPMQFALAAAFRVVRLFVVWGSADAATTQQFSGGRLVTGTATVASIGFVSLFLFGAIAAWRRGDAVALPLLLVAYVPATIAPMLTNMRYTVTVQPLMFIFVAVAVRLALGRAGLAPASAAARDRADTRTARQP